MIPDFQDFYYPVLEFFADFERHTTKEANEYIQLLFQVTPEEAKTKLYSKRFNWTLTYFVRAMVLERVEHAVYMITERGIDLFNESEGSISYNRLMQYPEFRKKEWDQRGSNKPQDKDVPSEERLQELRECDWKDFELAITTSVANLGFDYPFSYESVEEEGIKGLAFKEEEAHWIEAVQYDMLAVNGKRIKSFEQEMNDHEATKGVFMTTSRFSREALDSCPDNIELIDGNGIVQLLEESKNGPQPAEVIQPSLPSAKDLNWLISNLKDSILTWMKDNPSTPLHLDIKRTIDDEVTITPISQEQNANNTEGIEVPSNVDDSATTQVIANKKPTNHTQNLEPFYIKVTFPDSKPICYLGANNALANIIIHIGAERVRSQKFSAYGQHPSNNGIVYNRNSKAYLKEYIFCKSNWLIGNYVFTPLSSTIAIHNVIKEIVQTNKADVAVDKVPINNRTNQDLPTASNHENGPLKIEFEDGSILQHLYANSTFIEAINQIGAKRLFCWELSDKFVGNIRLLHKTTTATNSAQLRPTAEGYYVETRNTTFVKAQYLLAASQALNLGLKIWNNGNLEHLQKDSSNIHYKTATEDSPFKGNDIQDTSSSNTVLKPDGKSREGISKNIKVTLSNGKIICYDKPDDTLIVIIKMVGIEKVYRKNYFVETKAHKKVPLIGTYRDRLYFGEQKLLTVGRYLSADIDIYAQLHIINKISKDFQLWAKVELEDNEPITIVAQRPTTPQEEKPQQSNTQTSKSKSNSITPKEDRPTQNPITSYNQNLIIKVTYPNGDEVCFEQPLDTLKEVIHRAGPQTVFDLQLGIDGESGTTPVLIKESIYGSPIQDYEGLSNNFFIYSKLDTFKILPLIKKIAENTPFKPQAKYIARAKVFTSNTPNAKLVTHSPLSVQFPNGRTVRGVYDYNTLVEVIRIVGPQKVDKLNLEGSDLDEKHPPLIFYSISSEYKSSLKPVQPGFYVLTSSTTLWMAHLLRTISQRFNLGLTIWVNGKIYDEE